MRRAVEINPTNQWNTADMGSILAYSVEPTRRSPGLAGQGRSIRTSTPCLVSARPSAGRRCFSAAIRRRIEEFERSPERPYRMTALRPVAMPGWGRAIAPRRYAADCLETRPDFTIARWMAKVPYKNPADAAHLVECGAPRAAGVKSGAHHDQASMPVRQPRSCCGSGDSQRSRRGRCGKSGCRCSPSPGIPLLGTHFRPTRSGG